MTHVDHISLITRLVRDAGAAAALDELRATQHEFDASGYHDTLAVFTVWAVDRLVAAGLSDREVLWHPLADPRSPWSWYDDATLTSAAAREHFVASTRAGLGEPTPAQPRQLVAA